MKIYEMERYIVVPISGTLGTLPKSRLRALYKKQRPSGLELRYCMLDELRYCMFDVGELKRLVVTCSQLKVFGNYAGTRTRAAARAHARTHTHVSIILQFDKR